MGYCLFKKQLRIIIVIDISSKKEYNYNYDGVGIVEVTPLDTVPTTIRGFYKDVVKIVFCSFYVVNDKCLIKFTTSTLTSYITNNEVLINDRYNCWVCIFGFGFFLI